MFLLKKDEKHDKTLFHYVMYPQQKSVHIFQKHHYHGEPIDIQWCECCESLINICYQYPSIILTSKWGSHITLLIDTQEYKSWWCQIFDNQSPLSQKGRFVTEYVTYIWMTRHLVSNKMWGWETKSRRSWCNKKLNCDKLTNQWFFKTWYLWFK